jgi:hypothetical protein
MRVSGGLLVAAMLAAASQPASAVEGPTVAGPIGGTDVRSAMLPPPGLYGGAVAVGIEAFDFVDGQGQPIAALSEARLGRVVGGPFVLYVPDVQVFGGFVGIGAYLPYAKTCGHLFAGEPRSCLSGFGDPYVEIAWSRAFVRPRPSRYPGALPILEGLFVQAAFGVVVPTGQFDATTPTRQALSIGTNIWDFAPSVAITYTTPPIFAEGTEFSAKLYWNNYLTNPTTQYTTGTLINVDFAITERIGRFQVGLAGFYAFQVADDKSFGVAIPPDGRRGEQLTMGGVLVYDMPEYGAALKIKGLASIASATINTVNTRGLIVGVFKKFR